MANPISSILNQCQTGFTIGKKLKLTIIAIVYLVSPVDVDPDLLLPFGVVDDGVVLFLLV